MSTRRIRFTSSIDARLRRAAAREGVSIKEYVSRAVAERLARESVSQARATLAIRGMQDAARRSGANAMTLAEINRVIKEVRRGLRESPPARGSRYSCPTYSMGEMLNAVPDDPALPGDEIQASARLRDRLTKGRGTRGRR